MKITLDQDALAQAVTTHLRSVGVNADIIAINFRYTRVPYAMFAEVEISEAKMKIAKATPAIKSIVAAESDLPLLDPRTVEPEPTIEPDEPPPELPNTPLFGS